LKVRPGVYSCHQEKNAYDFFCFLPLLFVFTWVVFSTIFFFYLLVLCLSTWKYNSLVLSLLLLQLHRWLLKNEITKLRRIDDFIIIKIADTLYNYWLWNRLLSGFINLKKYNIHRAAGEVNIRFQRLINQIATYSKVNDCIISWNCFIVIY
jgi:hypothetical protein